MERTWICRAIGFGSPRSAIHLARTNRSFDHSNQEAFSGKLDRQTPESFDERIMLMSVLNAIEWTKKGNTEACLPNAKEVAAFATQFKPGHWCFLRPASENTCWNENSNELKRK